MAIRPTVAVNVEDDSNKVLADLGISSDTLKSKKTEMRQILRTPTSREFDAEKSVAAFLTQFSSSRSPSPISYSASEDPKLPNFWTAKTKTGVLVSTGSRRTIHWFTFETLKDAIPK